ncbi:MAG: adenylate kinase [Bacteroidales bacterium]|jgi:adenylate kinase|nr:adenylate kinase [Bacteroidales bacterium]
MINLVLFGPPGAGKGTYSEKIVEDFGLIHISTGDLLRKEIAEKTELGMFAKTKMDTGAFVPDDVVIGMINNMLEAHNHAKGFIFDGFPRTVAQAEALDILVKSRNMDITQVIAFEVEEEILIDRILLRGKESGRVDDQNYDTVKKRISVYHEKTAPVKDYYASQNKLCDVRNEGTIDEVYARVKQVLSL